jgi:hypothetical protein
MAWLVLKRRRHEGPYNTDSLAQSCKEGRLHPQDFIIDSGDLERGSMRYRRIIEILPHIVDASSQSVAPSAPVSPSPPVAPAPVAASERFRQAVQDADLVKAPEAEAHPPATDPVVEPAPRALAAVSAYEEEAPRGARFSPEFKRNAVAGLVIVAASFGGVIGFSKLKGSDRQVASTPSAPMRAVPESSGRPTREKSVTPAAPSGVSKRSRKSRSATDVQLRVPSLPEPPRPNVPQVAAQPEPLPEPPPPPDNNPQLSSSDVPQGSSSPAFDNPANPMVPESQQAASEPYAYDDGNGGGMPVPAPASEMPPEPMPMPVEESSPVY